MKTALQYDLYPQNTMKLHSVADIVYSPETNDELLFLLKQVQPDFLVLAAGSNVILPPRIRRPVISLRLLNQTTKRIADGHVYVGCSVRVQEFIRFLQANSLGGIEYLYSVPASVGGLIYMNGGRGKSKHMAISDYLECVEYLDLEDLTIKTYKVKLSDFSYRHSPFQDMNVIILAAYFNFKYQAQGVTEERIRERMDYSKKYLSADKPSCGSVFKDGNRVVYRLLRGFRVGGAMFSKKTSNWISNVDNASYDDVCALIKRAQIIHRLFLSKCQLEVKIIKQ